MATLSDYNIRVIATQTTPSKPGKQPRPVWNIEGDTRGYEQIIYDLGGKKWKGQFSFWDDPTDALLEAIEEQGRSSFGERLEAKKERAEGRAERYREIAENAEKRSDALHQKSRSILDPIPFGQPILVGHHSERRHRRAIERADAALGNACKESDKAKHYISKAAGAARTAADKDVPFMARRLKEAEARLRDIERKQANANAPDALYRTGCTTEQSLTNWKNRLHVFHQEESEQVEYWKAQIEAAGGIQFEEPEMKGRIKKGDFIWKDKDRDPYQVIRVNPTTVTAQCLVPGCSYFKPRIAYSDITKVVTQEEYEARKKEKADATTDSL
jgi:hypothetical protein